MNRPVAIGLIALVCVIGFWIVGSPHSGHGQRPAFNSRAELGSRVSGERTTRQAEVARLQRQIDDLSNRVEHLERQNLMSAQVAPVFTVAESEAAVALAEAKLEELRARPEDDPRSKVELAAEQLMLIRAQSQLRLAKLARTDGRLALETELAYAERRLFVEMQEESQLVRLVAKGYTSSEGLEMQKLDTAVARKNMERAKRRLDLFNQANGNPDETSQSETAPEPNEP